MYVPLKRVHLFNQGRLGNTNTTGVCEIPMYMYMFVNPFYTTNITREKKPFMTTNIKYKGGIILLQPHQVKVQFMILTYSHIKENILVGMIGFQLA